VSEVIIKLRGKPFLGVEKGNERGLQESAIFVTSQAKRLVNVDTGQARNSIMYKLGNGKEGGFNELPGEQAPAKISLTPKKDSAYVGGNLAHLIYLEFGTRNMTARPFLRPAGELLNIGQIKEANEQEMAKALKRGVKTIKLKVVK
jgi:HK97 gp10 family phage protein